MSESKKKIHYAWIILVGLSIVVGLGKGALNNSAGLFLTPVSKDLGIGIGSLSLYFSISSVVTMVVLPLGGKLMAKYDTKYLLVIAVILQGGAFAAMGLMTSVWGWYVLAIPLAIGGIFITVIAGPVLINQWFKQSKGLALGIMGASVGAIGALVQPLAGSLIATRGWSNAYMIIGIGVIVIVIPIVLLLIRKSPQDKGLLPYDKQKGSTANTIDAAVDVSDHGITLAVAKKSTAFYALLMFFFLMTSIASFTLHIPTYLTNQGYTVEFAGKLMGIYMVGVLIGALALGFMSDKIGTKLTSLIAMGLGMAAIVTMLLFVDNPVLIGVGAAVFGFTTATVGTVAPMLTATLFGNREYSQIYATASLGLAVAAVIALPAYGFIYDYTGTYQGVLIGLLVMFAINVVAINLAFKSKEQLVEQGHWK